MKKRIIALLPKSIRLCLRTFKGRGLLVVELFNDYRRFSRHSVNFRNCSTTQLQASLAAATHGIEKGLALREPRLWFGRDKIVTLVELLQEYVRLHGTDFHVARTIGTLNAYIDFHAKRGLTNPALEELVRGLEAESTQCLSAPEGYGIIQRTREEIHQAARIDWKGFVKTRHSVRNFSEKPVDRAIVEQAVALAQMTPSVCNRQSARVVALSGGAERMLELQGGSRGFGDQASNVLLILSDTAAFFPGERNQRWIDGGMFAMSLVYAFHSLGLGTCCLEWTSLRAKDKKLRELVPIKDSEVVIMMIAVGHLPEMFSVACSPRLSTEEVLRFHESGEAL